MKIKLSFTVFCCLFSFLSFAQYEINEKLITAARNSNFDLVVEMLKQGGDPNYTKHVGMGMSMRPLTCAAMNGNYEIAKALLEKGAKVHWTSGPMASAIVLAANKGKLSLVKLLVKYGANIHDKDMYGNSVLVHAENTKNKELINFVNNEMAKKPIEKKPIKIVNNEMSPDHINITGTKIFIKTPQNYTQNRSVYGFEKNENNSITTFDNIPQNYYQHARAFSKESWIARGGIVLQYDEMKFNGLDAKIFALEDIENKLSAMLLFGDSTFTTMISAKASSKENLNDIIFSLSTIVYDQNYKIDLDDVAVFTVKNTKTIFKNIDFQSDMFFYSSKRDKEKEIKDWNPVVNIGQSFQVPHKIETPKKSMRMMIASLREMGIIFPVVDVSNMPSQKLNEYQVLEYIQEGEYQGKPIQIYLFTLVTKDYVIRLNGRATKDFKKNIKQFKKLAYSLKIKEK